MLTEQTLNEIYEEAAFKEKIRKSGSSPLEEEELSHLENEMRRGNDLPLVWAKMGTVFLKAKRFDAARIAYEKIVKDEEHLPPVFWTDYANALAGLGRYQDALEALEKRGGEYSKTTIYARCQALIAMGKWEEALKLVEGDVTGIPGEEELLAMRSYILEKLDRGDEAYDVLDEILDTKQPREWEEVNNYFRTLRKLDYGQYYRFLGNSPRLVPDSIEIFRLRVYEDLHGSRFYADGEFKKYWNVLDRIMCKKEFKDHFILERVSCYQKLGAFFEAIDLIDDAKKDHDEVLVNGPLLHAELHTLFLAGWYERLVRRIEEVLMTDPLNTDLWLWHSAALYKCGRLDEALSSMEKVIAQQEDHSSFPCSSFAYWFKGELLNILGRPKEAEECRIISKFTAAEGSTDDFTLYLLPHLPHIYYTPKRSQIEMYIDELPLLEYFLYMATPEEMEKIEKRGIVLSPSNKEDHRSYLHSNLIEEKEMLLTTPNSPYSKRAEYPIVIAVPRKDEYNLVDRFSGLMFSTDQTIPSKDIIGVFNFQDYDDEDEQGCEYANWIFDLNEKEGSG